MRWSAGGWSYEFSINYFLLIIRYVRPGGYQPGELRIEFMQKKFVYCFEKCLERGEKSFSTMMCARDQRTMNS